MVSVPAFFTGRVELGQMMTDDCICPTGIQRNYLSKLRETGRVVNLLDVMEEARELEIAGENGPNG